MANVTLVGPSDDGRELVLATGDGQELRLPITDELRALVRHAHAQAQARAATAPAAAGDRAMSPKEIQQRIRGGLNAAELAELTGAPRADIEKFEAPVLAERAYIADLARQTRIGRESGSPVLGDLVTDRLAGRGVAPEDIAWDAWREIDEPWHVAADYRVDGRSIRAEWTFDHTARAVTAEDEESRWLTETELLDVPIPQRHLSAVRSTEDNVRPLHETRPVSPAEDGPAPESGPSSTELLLEDLEERRGTRDSVEMDDDDADDEEFEGFGPASRSREADVGFAAGNSMPHPAGSARRDQTRDGEDDGGDAATDAAPAPAAEAKPAKKGRASVPSWDEIVFGAKHD